MESFAIHMFDNIDYLTTGSKQQQLAYESLSAARIFERLAPYHPLLVGTIPLDIAVMGSDLDIICEASDLDEFCGVVERCFSDYEQFSSSTTYIGNQETVLVHFHVMGFQVEIFAQAISVKKQNGYLHMIKEYEILTKRGQEFKEKIIALKNQGLKTEPAFATLLNIQGDPYEGLLLHKII